MGNILTVHKDGSLILSYEYDSQGQLTRENNVLEDYTTLYTYGLGGNILYKNKLPYTTDSTDSLFNTSGVVTSYSYGNSTWGDQLTSYRGTNITYDAIGNPLNWRNASALNWQGRELQSLTLSDGTVVSYEYNSSGVRTKKTVGNTVYEYILDGTKILKEIQTVNGTVTAQIEYVYDENGSPIGCIWNGYTYFYQKNLQGDVISIVDPSCNIVVSYSYDAWGNLLSITGTKAATLGVLNSIRYRSYYYDTETGFYYLNSRYYDPQVTRFLNADVVGTLTVGYTSISQYNMFAYCLNNPVNMVDDIGAWPKWFENATKVVSAVVAVVAVVATVSAVTAFTAGTGTAAAVYGASIALGASLSGINAGIANESNGNSYFNGYVGGAVSGATQSAAGKLPGGTIWGGALGTSAGTAITMGLNNLDPDSSDATASEIVTEVTTSAIKATAMSTVTAGVGASVGGIDYTTGELYGGVSDACGGLMPSLTLGFGEGIKAFFGTVDDAFVYLLR